MTAAPRTPAADAGSTGRDACAAIARRHDPERYLACLFAPAGSRDALLAVLAANHEIAKTAEVVSEPDLGRIRLQWWREALDGIEAGRPRAHEVAEPLAAAVSQGLRLERLRAVIDAREADLDGEPPADLAELEAYARASAGELHAALAGILGADPGAAVDGGTAWGLLGLMRAAPGLIRRGRSPIPAALLQDLDLTPKNSREEFAIDQLKSVVRPVVQVASRRLAVLRDSPGFRAPQFRPLRLLADRAGDHARLLAAAGYEPASLAAPPPGLAWRYARRALGYRLGL